MSARSQVAREAAHAALSTTAAQQPRSRRTSRQVDGSYMFQVTARVEASLLQLLRAATDTATRSHTQRQRAVRQQCKRR